MCRSHFKNKSAKCREKKKERKERKGKVVVSVVDYVIPRNEKRKNNQF